MIHRDAWALLEEYLDGSLGAADRWAVTVHLADCPVCRQHLARQARLRGLVRDHLASVAAPAGLNERLRSASARDSRPATFASVPRSVPVGPRLAAVLGPAIVALWLLARVTAPVGGSAPALYGELAVAHALFAQDESLLDVAGDARTVSSWFRNQAGLAVTAPNLDGYELLGGRLLVLHGAPVPQLVYESHPDERYLSVIQLDDAHPRPDTPGPLTHLGAGPSGSIATLVWQTDQGWAALVGDVPAAELRRLALELERWPRPASSSAS